jgi:phenylacetate-CoA ligase
MGIPYWLIRHIIAPLWAYYERSPYLKISQQLKATEHMSLDERLAGQWDKLGLMIRHASLKSPYYKKKFRDIGFHPEDLKSWKDFNLIPVLTKEDVRKFSEEMLEEFINKEELIPRMTSGSTGSPLYFFVKENEFQFKRGATIYRDEWTGWRLGELRAIVWGDPIDIGNWRKRMRSLLLERIIGLDTLRIEDESLHNFVRQILDKKPTLLFGHAHSLYLLANFWKREKHPIYRFKGILSTAMVLHDYERSLCEEIFQSPVFNRYGCEEVSLIASECEAHNGLHINTDNLVVEILGNNQNVEPGTEGYVVVTDLTNTAMPFIRYQVGDMAIPSLHICSCGRTYPLLKKVTGRTADYLLTPEGKWVSGISLTDHFATLIPGVKQIQIIQNIRDQILLRIVPTSELPEISSMDIKVLVEKFFGPRMEFKVEMIERLSPEPSGKYRFSICNLHD